MEHGRYVNASVECLSGRKTPFLGGLSLWQRSVGRKWQAGG
jgi:hypothetical protein